MSSAASSIAAESSADAAPSTSGANGNGTPARAAFGATDLGLILMATIWGVNYSVVKVGLQAMSPITFGGLRVLLAAVVLACIAAATRAPLPSRRDVFALMGLGLIGNGVYQLLFLIGMSRTPAGVAALLVAASPAYIAIIQRLLGRERLPMRGWVGIALQLLGVACVAGSTHGTSTSGGNALLGTAFIAAGSITWAVFTVFLQPYTSRVHPFQLSSITLASGAVLCMTVAAPGLLALNWGAVPFNAWWAMLYASVASMVIAYLLYYHGIRVLGATRTAVYANLQPLIALAVAAIMLSERPTGWQLLGATLIMGGLLMSRTARVTPTPVRSSVPDRS